jgi:hypothetical protein
MSRISLSLVLAAGLLTGLAGFTAARTPDADLRLKCARLGGDLSEPAGILAFRRCLTAENSPVAPTPAADTLGCLPGLVHRRATPEDIVCVSPRRAAEISLEALAALGRAQPGSDRCQQGFVWRDAVPADHVCAPPASRQLAGQENARALDGFAYAAAASQNLCAYLDPAKIGRDLGQAEAPEVQSTGAGDCKIAFASSRALVEIDVVPRAQFGFGPAGPNALVLKGLGEKAVFDDRAGSDGLRAQRLDALLADSALTIQVSRAKMPNVRWAEAEATTILTAIAARAAKLP